MLKSARSVGSRMLSLALTLVLIVTAVPLFGLTTAAADVSGIVYGEIPIKHVDTTTDPATTTVDMLYGVIGYNGSARTVTIPSSNDGYAVEYVKEYAFAGTGVTSVKLPDTIRGIGKGAFMDCPYLNTVVVGTNASISDFGDFEQYSALKAESNSIVGDNAFANCVSLRHFAVYTKVDPTTLSNANLATAKSFAGCGDLTLYGWGTNNVVKTYADSVSNTYVDLSVVAQNVKGVSIAPKSTFMAIKETEQLTVSVLPEAAVGIVGNIYSYLTSDPNVINVGDTGLMTAVGYGTATVTVVSINGFSDSCTITVAERVEGDYIYRFLEDGSVEIVSFDSGVAGDISVPATIAGKPITSIGNYAFKGCTGIKSLTLPNTVKTIGIGAFYDCTGLALFTAPTSLIAVAGSAFYGCTALSIIDFSECPNLISIGDAAFRNCSSLAAVFLPANLTTIGKDAFVGDTVLKVLSVPSATLTLETTVTYFDASAPLTIYNAGNSSISAYAGMLGINLSGTVDDVNAFSWVSLEPTLIIGQTAALAVDATVGGVVKSGYVNAAFATDNKNVLSVSGGKATAVGAGIANLYAIAPNGFVASVSITVTKGKSGDYEYRLIENMTKAEIVGFINAAATSAVIPATVNFKGTDIPVTSIGFAAFADATSLKSLTIGAGITSVNGSSFDCAYALEEILVAAGNASYTTVDGVLFNKSETALIKYPASKEGDTYQVPAGIVNLGNYAFKDNKYITYIEFPSKLTTIGSHCFESMESLMSAELPSEVTAIGEFAFTYTALDYVLIPKKTAVIGASAFLGTPVVIYGYKGYYAETYAAENAIAFMDASLLVMVSEIRLSVNSIVLSIGETEILTASVYPASASFPKYIFESLDPAIATIDADGKIKAIAVGTAQIYAKSSCGVSTVCTVIVSDDASAVPVNVSSIDIRVTPDKTTYENGEPLNLAGIRVFAIYTDGSEALIIDGNTMVPGVRIRGYNALVAGSQSVEIIYGDRIGTVSVTVLEKKLVSIAVTSQPDKIVYVTGSLLNTEGVIITATYNNGTTEDVTPLCTFSALPTKPGNASITVKYETFKTSFIVSVIEKTVVDVSIKAPAKTEYFAGDTFDTTGFSAEAVYDNGTTGTLYAKDFVFAGYDMDAPGKQQVTATHTTADGTIFTGTFSITVTAVQVTGIRIAVEPDKQIYENGDAFDLTGAEIFATYNNGAEDKIYGTGVAPGKYTIKIRKYNPLIASSQTVELVYGDFATTLTTVTVLERRLTDIEITSLPLNTTCVEGANIDTTGLVVTAIYNNGQREAVTDYTTTPAPTAVGTGTITVFYNSFTAQFTVTVIKKSLVSIEITAPLKSAYLEGDMLDIAGFEAIGTYNNGMTAELSEDDFVFTGFNPHKIGNQTVTATYTDENNKAFSKKFVVTVTARTLKGIKIEEQPDKQVYIEGEKLDLTGMVVKAYYDNDTFEILSPKYLFEFDKYLSLGETYFTIEYEGFTDTFKVLAKLGNYQNEFSYRFVNEATGIEVVNASSTLTDDYALPAKIGDSPVVSLAVNSFINNDLLARVVIPDSVTKLGTSVFSGCDWLNTVIIGEGVTAIPDKAFFGCDSLNMVVLPDSVRQIGDLAFSQCASLLCVVIPESTIVISKNAFDYGNEKMTIVGADESYAQTYAAANNIQFAIREALAKNDVDGNGTFNIADARKAVRLAAGLDAITGTQLLLADMDSSGVISLADARQLLRESAGLK